LAVAEDGKVEGVGSRVAVEWWWRSSGSGGGGGGGSGEGGSGGNDGNGGGLAAVAVARVVEWRWSGGKLAVAGWLIGWLWMRRLNGG
jgi:hypothetical protein